jgi:hypothetical protein
MNTRNASLSLLVAALLAPVFSAASRAEVAPASASLDGGYKGMLVCAQFPEQRDVLRVPLDVMIEGKTVRFSRPIESGAGGTVGNEMAEGILDGDKSQLSSAGANYGACFEGRYDLVVAAGAGTLTGVQSWTIKGVTKTRPCTGAFVKSL